jgi:hypothetical protein
MVPVQATPFVPISDAGTDKYCCSSLQGCHVQLESHEGNAHFTKLNVRWDVYAECNVMARHGFFRFHIKERGTAEQREKAIGNMVGLIGSVLSRNQTSRKNIIPSQESFPGKRSAPGHYRDPMTLRHKRRPLCCAT